MNVNEQIAQLEHDLDYWNTKLHEAQSTVKSIEERIKQLEASVEPAKPAIKLTKAALTVLGDLAKGGIPIRRHWSASTYRASGTRTYNTKTVQNLLKVGYVNEVRVSDFYRLSLTTAGATARIAAVDAAKAVTRD